jgi:hypothetical protein
MDFGNAVDLASLATLVLKVKEFLRDFSQRRTTSKRQSEKDSESTLKALLTALNETQIYIGKRRKHKSTEAKLSRLWTAAALRIRSYDIDLAKRCQMKGVYWTNPDSWSDDDIEKTRIAIDEVAESINKLL